MDGGGSSWVGAGAAWTSTLEVICHGLSATSRLAVRSAWFCFLSLFLALFLPLFLSGKDIISPTLACSRSVRADAVNWSFL